MTVGDLKARLRDLERQTYRLGEQINLKDTPGRRAALERITKRYDALAQRCYKLGIQA